MDLEDAGMSLKFVPKQALTPAQCRSPLGRRPYDLRHAAVSLWLNSGVPTPPAPRTPDPSPNPATREMTTACRHPEIPGQRHKDGQAVGITAPAGPARGFSAPSVD
jgi:hypothetical protein